MRVSSYFRNPLFGIILLGITIRFLLAPLLTYTFDFSGWALVIQNIQSGNGLYDLDGYYYSPPWGYVLAVFSKLSNIFGLTVFGEQIVSAFSVEWYGWYFDATATSPAFNLLVKTPMILSDLVAGYLIYWIVMDITDNRKKAISAFAIWFICPFVISVGCVGGQFDSLSAVFTLLTIIFLRKDRNFLAGVTFSLAFLTKLFPAILIFLFVAYIYRKHSENKIWIRHVVKSIFGFTLATVIILLPNIIEGNLGACFAYLTNRVSYGLGGSTQQYTQYLTVITYVAIAIISIFLAKHMARSKHDDLTYEFFFYGTLTLSVLFLYPSTPQYMLLLFPFLIFWYVLYDHSIKWPLVMMMIGTTMFSLASNFTLLLSLADYSELISIPDLMVLIDAYQQPFLGLSCMAWQYYAGGVLQWISVVWILYILLLRWKKENNHQHSTKKAYVPFLPTNIRDTFMKLSNRQRQYLLFGGAYGFAAILLYVLVRLFEIPSSVYDGYFPYADAMLSGTVPYTELVFAYDHYTSWEYPPLSYLFILIPRLFASNPASYQAAFIVMTLVVFLIGLYFTEKIANNLGYNPSKVMLAYTVMMMLMFEFQVDRFDIIPAVLTIIAFSMFIQKRYEWTFILLGIGTLIKLYPAFFIPILVIYLLSNKEYVRTAKSLLAVGITVAAILCVFVALDSDPFAFMTYHTERPLEIESLAASVISFLGLFVHLDITTVFSFGSDNIVGPLPDAISSVLLWVLGGLMLITYAAYAYFAFKKKGTEIYDIFTMSLMILLIFMLFSTVFSGQYIIWAIPVVLLCLVISKNKSNSMLIFLLFILIEILTQINFAVNFGMRGEGMGMSALGIIVVLIRNLTVLYLLFTLPYILSNKRPPMPKRLERYIDSKISE